MNNEVKYETRMIQRTMGKKNYEKWTMMRNSMQRAKLGKMKNFKETMERKKKEQKSEDAWGRK